MHAQLTATYYMRLSMCVSDPTSIARNSYSKELNRKLRHFETNEALSNDFVITCQTDFATTCSQFKRFCKQFKPFSETNQHSTCLVML